MLGCRTWRAAGLDTTGASGTLVLTLEKAFRLAIRARMGAVMRQLSALSGLASGLHLGCAQGSRADPMDAQVTAGTQRHRPKAHGRRSARRIRAVFCATSEYGAARQFKPARQVSLNSIMVNISDPDGTAQTPLASDQIVLRQRPLWQRRPAGVSLCAWKTPVAPLDQ